MHRHLLGFLLFATSVLGLAACSSGGDASAPAPAPIPGPTPAPVVQHAEMEWSRIGGGDLEFVASKDADEHITIVVNQHDFVEIHQVIEVPKSDPIYEKMLSIMIGKTPIELIAPENPPLVGTWLGITLTIDDEVQDYSPVDRASQYIGEIEDWVVSNLGASA